MSSLKYLLHREPLLAPLVEPASHAHDMGIAHLLERLSREQRASAGGALHDDASIPLRRDLWLGVGRCRVGIPLQHAAWGQHRSWNIPLAPLVRLPTIHHQPTFP